MSKGRKILYSLLAVWIGGIVLFVILFGFKSHKAPDVASGIFSPTDEFKLDTWFKLGPIAFNKGVLYLLLAAGITHRGDAVHRQAPAAAPRPPAGRGRGVLQLHPWHVDRKTSTRTCSASTSR